MKKYMLRLDDACETMDKDKWSRIEVILDNYNIKPIVGVIPNNKDQNLFFNRKDPLFWDKITAWIKKEWEIALHGYDHVYISNYEGINPIHKRSEFAGVKINIQKEKISLGYKIFKDRGVYPKIFFAPSHTFDKETIKIILKETDIKFISDTFVFRPYKRYGINFIPQQFGKVREFPMGLITFCYHPNTMLDKDFIELENFLKKNYSKFIKFSQVENQDFKRLNIFEKFLQNLYYMYRKLKNRREVR